MKKVIIAIDSFKGSLSSRKAGEAAEEGLLSVFPDCETHVIAIADGGEGLLDTLSGHAGGRKVQVAIHGPLMENINAEYHLLPDGKTAIIESATACGLHLVPSGKRNPMNTTSYGLGELIKDAALKGCRHLIIGLGGSSTNDAGMGMLQALGYRLYDASGHELGQGGRILNHIHTIDDSERLPELKDIHFTIACDVDSPFCGPEGAAYVFAAQKGAGPEMIQLLDNGLHNAGLVMEQTTRTTFMTLRGTGAAGGLGGCLQAFLKAKLKKGIELILDYLSFDSLIEGADLIITGEGKADRQTLMGKVPYGILKRAKRQNIPVILIAGSINDQESLSSAGFSGAFSITPAPITLESAMQPEKTFKNISLAISQLAILLKNISK